MRIYNKFNYKESIKKGNIFGKNVVIEDGVSIGCNNIFHDNCVIKSGTSIGDNNRLETGTVIGEFPEEYVIGSCKQKKILEHPEVIIGSRNFLEAYTVIQGALETKTIVGNDVRVGAFSYIAHDANIHDNVAISSHCVIAGYCILLDNVNLGMGATIHQRTVLGAFSMVGAGGIVVNHIAPAALVIGVPATFLRINYLGLERRDIPKNKIDEIEKWLLTGCRESCIPECMLDHYEVFKNMVKIWGRERKIIPVLNDGGERRMYNVTVIVGVRPHYVKASGLNELFKGTQIRPFFFDVQQHYDEYLHDNYIEGFEVKHAMHKMITNKHKFAGQIMDIEEWLESDQGKESKAVIVLGDANPAMAGAIAANRMKVPIIHIEAGVRRIETEQEHWNSIVADHLSSIRYCYTEKGIVNLKREGLENNSYMVGDILAEWMIQKAQQIKASKFRSSYYLISIHRPQNCNRESILALCKAIKEVNKKVIWILHPRTMKYKELIKSVLNAEMISSQKHDDALALLKFADLIITDSGGFIREGVLLGKPVIVCHEQGMWEELVANNIIRKTDMTLTMLRKAINSYSELNYTEGGKFFVKNEGNKIFMETLTHFLKRI